MINDANSGMSRIFWLFVHTANTDAEWNGGCIKDQRKAQTAAVSPNHRKRERRFAMGAMLKSTPMQEETNRSVDHISHPNRPGRDELVPSRYALRIGEIEVLVISDGVLMLPGAMLGYNADAAVRGAWLDDKF